MPRHPWSFVQTLSFPELLAHLGGIAAERVRLDPPPGRATEKDVDRLDVHEDRLYELIDGILVEKVYNFYDSMIAARIVFELGAWNIDTNYGLVSGASAPFRFGPRQVRMPDAAITSWDRLPGGLPIVGVPDLAPNVAVEVLNPANTVREMTRKLADYFAAGTELVWCVEPRRELVEVYSDSDQREILKAGELLDGGSVLPGFTLPVAKIFEKRAPGKKPGKKSRK